MKKSNYIKLYGSISAFALLFILSCTKSDHYYKEFIEEASRLYVGKVDSVKVHPGKNRIKLSWTLSPDQSSKRINIYWNNRADSLVRPVRREAGIDTSEVMIEGLNEGNYTFDIFTYDENDNKSIGVEVFGKAYGSIYEGNLSNRVIKTINANADSVTISWFDEFSETLKATEVSYIGETGEREHQLLLPQKNLVTIHHFPLGSELKYRSLHLPDTLAIDTFYSSTTTLVIE